MVYIYSRYLLNLIDFKKITTRHYDSIKSIQVFTTNKICTFIYFYLDIALKCDEKQK